MENFSTPGMMPNRFFVAADRPVSPCVLSLQKSMQTSQDATGERILQPWSRFPEQVTPTKEKSSFKVTPGISRSPSSPQVWYTPRMLALLYGPPQLSATTTDAASHSTRIFASAVTSTGWVVAANSGFFAMTRFGFTQTRLPVISDRSIPIASRRASSAALASASS